MTIKTRQKKTLKEDKPKRPAKLLIHKVGGLGDYVFTFQSLTEDNSPCPKAIVRILDMRAIKTVQNIEMDKNGCGEFILKFDESERIIKIILLSSTFSEEIRLLGPKQRQAW